MWKRRKGGVMRERNYREKHAYKYAVTLAAAKQRRVPVTQNLLLEIPVGRYRIIQSATANDVQIKFLSVSIFGTFFMPVIYQIWKIGSTPVPKLVNDHPFIDLWEQHADTDWQSHQHGTLGLVRSQNGRSQRVMAATLFHARFESESMTTRDSSWLWQPDALLFICLALQNPKLFMWEWERGMNSLDALRCFFVITKIFALKLYVE